MGKKILYPFSNLDVNDPLLTVEGCIGTIFIETAMTATIKIFGATFKFKYDLTFKTTTLAIYRVTNDKSELIELFDDPGIETEKEFEKFIVNYIYNNIRFSLRDNEYKEVFNFNVNNK